MPFLDRLAIKVTDQMPSMIGSRMHSLVDYATGSAFLLYGASAWGRDRRVAVSSVGCGLFHLLTSAVTDYSERRPDRLNMEHHARLDLGLAAMVGTMPTFMGMKDKRDIRFFRWQAVIIGAAAGLTDFVGTGERKQLSRIDKELRNSGKAA